MDGYWIYSQQDSDTAQALDPCNGHVTEPLDYHYHAGAEDSNAILGCLVAQYGCALDDPDASCDASVMQGPPDRR